MKVNKMKYNPKNELKVDTQRPEIQAKIAEAKRLYRDFANEFSRKLDFEHPESISETYQAAQEMGIFAKAQEVRELFFGTDMHFYGVSYLWDKKTIGEKDIGCINDCQYCPAGKSNREKATSEYKLRELTPEQAVEDTLAVMADGHTHVCYLTTTVLGRKQLPDEMARYLREFDKLGLDEIILNIEPVYKEGFETMRGVVSETLLQFRVFQETYNRETYAKMHPRGPKADYDFRRQSQARAIRAGFDNVGIGALFGLHRFPIEEVEGLKEHAEELEREHGKGPARVCLPSANELTNIGVKIPYFLRRGTYSNDGEEIIEFGDYEKFNELTYALARLAMPTRNIVGSERDRPAMLKILRKYETCETLNVHPGVGDNANVFPCNGYKQTHFEQATTFPRDPKKTIEEMRGAGYNPIIGK